MRDEPRSILVLHPTFEEWGGAERFLHGMLERFVSHRAARVRLLTHRWDAPWGDSPSYEVVQHRRGGYHTRPADWERIARDVVEAARGHDVVWIHNYPATEWWARARALADEDLPGAHWYCHEPPASLWGETPAGKSAPGNGALAALGRLAAHGARAPARAARALRDRLVPAPDLDALRASEARALDSISAIQANSRFTAARVKALYDREAEVVYPIAEDLGGLAPVGASRASLVLWVGRLAEPKRPLLMLEAWRLACERCPGLRDYELVLVGDGPLRERVEEALASPHLERARLRRGLTRAELVETMQSALVTVHLGLAEPLGLVPIEAMACGSAVIAHAEGGALETVAEGETGWRSPIQTAEDLASLLARVPGERSSLEAMGRAGPARVAELFSAERCEAGIWALLSSSKRD